MLTESRKAPLILLAMLGLGVAALILPPLIFRDRPADVSASACRTWGGRPCEWAALRRLKTPIHNAYKIPPGFMQVTDARVYGDTEPYAVEGAVAWRSLFGIRVGESRHSDRETRHGLAIGSVGALWAAFLVTEGALGVLLYRQLGPGNQL